VFCLLKDAAFQGAGQPFWTIYELFNFHFEGGKLEGVYWDAMPAQVSLGSRVLAWSLGWLLLHAALSAGASFRVLRPLRSSHRSRMRQD
jgi:hypothetical protein